MSKALDMCVWSVCVYVCAVVVVVVVGVSECIMGCPGGGWLPG